jgi:hypothetical protein
VLEKRTVQLALAGLWLGVVPGVAADGSCPELQGAKPQVHLEYLQRDRAVLTPACIAYAADQIGLQQYSPAVKTLLRYLDYRLPEDPARAHLAAISRTPTLGTLYPATDALFEIGKPAVPDLVELIASSATSEIARSNAIQVLFLIHRSDVAESVRVLMRASKASSDREASMRLYDAARAAAAKCKEPGHNSCMSALSESEAHEE